MPTISPALTLRLTRVDDAAGLPRPRRQRPARSSTVRRVVARATRSARSRTSVSPIIMRLISATLVDLRIAAAGQLAAPQHREGIAERLHLAELVADHQHGDLAALRHIAEQAEHLVGLAGGQHRGRLVEDQEALFEIEQLEDFELLLLAGRERRHRRVERHPERHAVHEGGRAAALSFFQSMIAGASAREMTRFSAAVRQGTSVKCW